MKNKRIECNAEEFLQSMEKDLGDKYQVALHQIGVFGTPESIKKVHSNNFWSRFRKLNSKDYCESIMNSGLQNRWDDVGYTIMQFGSMDEIEKNKDLRKDSFLDYEYGNLTMAEEERSKDLYDVLIAIPTDVTVDGDKHFLGYYEYAQDEKAKQTTDVFNKRNIPSEFIYGYVHKHDEIYDLVLNSKHFSLMDKEKQEEFIKTWSKENGIDLEKLNITKEEKIEDEKLKCELKEKVVSEEEQIQHYVGEKEEKTEQVKDDKMVK